MNKLLSYLAEHGVQTIQNKNLYKDALTHASYKNEHNVKSDYEKLEFLGDSILEYVISTIIFKYRSELTEGEMSRLRSSIVQSASLANYARKDKLYNFIKTGNSITKGDLKKSDKFLEDIFESLVAAVYLDNGIDIATEFIKSYVYDDILKFDIKKSIDYKSLLQEVIQNKYKENPVYESEQIQTDLNQILFKSYAIVNNQKISIGYGYSKKEAEKDSAKKYLKKEGFIDE